MEYSNLIDELNALAEPTYKQFQQGLISTKQIILGVRTAHLRNIAKRYREDIPLLMRFPDVYFEVTFIKLAAVALLGYDQFILYVEDCVALIDNWATCDAFKAKCIKTHKKAFLSILQRFFAIGSVFHVRYVLVTLLYEYIEEEYLPIIAEYIQKSDTSNYYIHMAVAWLIAEILARNFNAGLEMLKVVQADAKTHNKAIQKARESFRITKEQKEYLHSLKIK